MIKMEVRGFCVQYLKRKNRKRRNREKELSDQIDALMKALVINRSKENITKLYNPGTELNKIAEYRTKGAIIRSRMRWHEQGEKNTKYFLYLEKRQNSKTFISKLKSQDGLEITGSNEILNCQKMFYKNLYTAVPRSSLHDNQFFENPNLPKLTDIELDELDRPLTKQECFEILKVCAKDKCPGSDGFTVEFYLHFWSILGEEMVQSFNYALAHGHLNITQRQGIIKVAPKKRKNKLYLENWRPISLLNIDYKIISKTLASSSQTYTRRPNRIRERPIYRPKHQGNTGYNENNITRKLTRYGNLH